ncbi:phosphoglucomutase (PGM) [Monocercomonoides exilis]|uniref:phosphoglucomutase (PGM) n=1 Tax=Monocercomonoides exilis TaxID=2049356 RepID=UPI0035597F6A|nr:phosphoglucomutase (PGM) [Monocercomonoides exilis]
MASTLSLKTVPTKPFPDALAGTSGLRKKVPVFMQENYVENWLEALFFTQPPPAGKESILITGGDGRFYSEVVIQKVMKMALAHGYKRIIVGKDGILSTPSVSAIIRERKADGGVILTASHNPGGPTQDFGMKYNISSGAPAPEGVMHAQYEHSQKLTSYTIADVPDFDISKVQTIIPFSGVTIEIIDPCDIYINLMKQIFNFDLIKSLFQRKHFKFTFDALHGVTGPYALRLFHEEFGCPVECLMNCNPLPDFGGLHPDPNQVYAHTLVERMYADSSNCPDFGAACDGDGDRNMILGNHCFVNPADSLAIIAESASECIPFFAREGVKGVARSSPTAPCVDRVAAAKSIPCYETPTGWKFFGNLMDAGKISICGEESFGTGSIHIREKDGLWAVLCWLSIIAHESNKRYPLSGSSSSSAAPSSADSSAEGKVVSVQEIMDEYWTKHGKYFIQRHDYEGVDSTKAHSLYDTLRDTLAGKSEEELKKITGDDNAKSCDVFNYTDPVDGSYSPNNGIRFKFVDGSRFVVRLSGTSSSGATIRVYYEKYSDDKAQFHKKEAEVLEPLVATFSRVSKIREITGFEKPTVIT